MALVFDIKVFPSAGKFAFAVSKTGELVCYLKSAPEKGQANRELIKGLAKRLKVTQSDIEIMSGLTSQKKRIKIHIPLEMSELYGALELPYQSGFIV
jgi:uncharacterized protein (TIGR00251 family)